MLLKAVGVLMMLDGVMSAAAVLPMLDTLVYRSLRDQSLFAAHLLIGALLLLSGKLLLENRGLFLFPALTVVAAFAIAAIETTRFDWPWLVARAAYSVFALAVSFKTTLPKIRPDSRAR